MSGAVCFLWHFPSAGLEPGVPDVIRHTALRSSDFPLPATEDAESDRPVRLPTEQLYDDEASIRLSVGLAHYQVVSPFELLRITEASSQGPAFSPAGEEYPPSAVIKGISLTPREERLRSG